jgi:hypothetical protein
MDIIVVTVLYRPAAVSAHHINCHRLIICHLATVEAMKNKGALGQHKLSGAQRKKRPALRRWMLRKFGNGTEVPCAGGCGKILTEETMTIDRYPIPGRDGGKYYKNNVRPMCRPCNSSHTGETS